MKTLLSLSLAAIVCFLVPFISLTLGGEVGDMTVNGVTMRPVDSYFVLGLLAAMWLPTLIAIVVNKPISNPRKVHARLYLSGFLGMATLLPIALIHQGSVEGIVVMIVAGGVILLPLLWLWKLFVAAQWEDCMAKQRI